MFPERQTECSTEVRYGVTPVCSPGTPIRNGPRHHQFDGLVSGFGGTAAAQLVGHELPHTVDIDLVRRTRQTSAND